MNRLTTCEMFFDIWQRDLEIAQMRSNLEELKEKLNKERNINLKKVCIIQAYTHTHTHTQALGKQTFTHIIQTFNL
jgi:hypothetical protein